MNTTSELTNQFSNQVAEINRLYHKHGKLELAANVDDGKLRLITRNENDERVTLTDWLGPRQAKEYLQEYKQKRCLDPTKLDRFFSFSDDAKIISIDRLKPTRAREKGIKNALKYMHEAYHGLWPRRKPLSVRPSGEYKDCYDILDGNSTWHVAIKIGMEALPAHVV